MSDRLTAGSTPIALGPAVLTASGACHSQRNKWEGNNLPDLENWATCNHFYCLLFFARIDVLRTMIRHEEPLPHLLSDVAPQKLSLLIQPSSSA